MNRAPFSILKDKAGNSVEDLEISHEKLFHLIIVDEEQAGLGEFCVANRLPEGFYKAFI